MTNNKQQTEHRFCLTPELKCTMSYCDENGCINRQRHLVGDPIEMTNNKQQTAVDYMESIAEELRLNGVENVVVNGGTINILSLGVSIRYDYAHRPNIMADVYRCLSHLGTRIHNEHLSNKLQSIKTYGGGEQ